MARKIPKIINSDEYAQLLGALNKLKFPRIPKRKLNHYKVAIYGVGSTVSEGGIISPLFIFSDF